MSYKLSIKIDALLDEESVVKDLSEAIKDCLENINEVDSKCFEISIKVKEVKDNL